MFEDSLQQIYERWKKAFGQYETLKKAAETAVVRWEWTKGIRYSLRPYYFNRFLGRARVMKKPPSGPGYYIRYGFDEANRVRVERTYNYHYLYDRARFERHLKHGFNVTDSDEETFYSYLEELTECIQFSIPPRIPLKIEQVYYQKGQVNRYASFKLNGYTPLFSQKGKNPDVLYEWLGYNGRFKTIEEYHYDGNRLGFITSYNETPGLSPFLVDERFNYDEAGKLERIESLYQDGRRQTIYQKRKLGQTFSSIRDEALKKMVSAVVERLKAADIKEKLYCIELSYQAVLRHFPPFLVPGLESYRQSLIKSGKPGKSYEIFAPVLQGKDWFFEITDPETLETCQQLEQEIQAGEKWNAARQILRQLAAELTHYDWTGILDVTPDFIVFAIDHEMEGDQLEAVLKGSASKEQIREWKKKGWL
jgi:hypothetical protein